MDIDLRGIVKTYGKDRSAPALHGIDLHIRSGELLGLLGPSGSGKTTLLRIIAGLEIPAAGQVLFGESDASLRPVQERGVGFVFQHYALFKHLTVAGNIAYGLKIRPRRQRPRLREISRRVEELLDLVQLNGLADRFPAQLSGGERQRVALARALAVDPKVLLLDEPFGALDAKVRKDLRRWLRALHTRIGHTTVFVTHDQDEALELSDRIAVLNHGRIEQIGMPDEIYERPASAFIFSFVGESSRLEARLAQGRLTFEDTTTLPFDAGTLPDGSVTLFFRPYDVVITDFPDGDLKGIVTASRRIGSIRRVEIAIGASRVPMEADLPASQPVHPGRPVGLKLLTSTLFTATGESRILPSTAKKDTILLAAKSLSSRAI